LSVVIRSFPVMFLNVDSCSIHECGINLHVSVFYVWSLVWYAELDLVVEDFLVYWSERVTSFSQSCSDHIGDVSSQLLDSLKFSPLAHQRTREPKCQVVLSYVSASL
jgi:hypothetical protein